MILNPKPTQSGTSGNIIRFEPTSAQEVCSKQPKSVQNKSQQLKQGYQRTTQEGTETPNTQKNTSKTTIVSNPVDHISQQTHTKHQNSATNRAVVNIITKSKQQANNTLNTNTSNQFNTQPQGSPPTYKQHRQN